MTATATVTNPTQVQNQNSCPVQGAVEQLSATSDTCERRFERTCTLTSQDRLRERAYLLWEKAGFPISDGVEFWYAAEQEMLADTQ